MKRKGGKHNENWREEWVVIESERIQKIKGGVSNGEIKDTNVLLLHP